MLRSGLAPFCALPFCIAWPVRCLVILATSSMPPSFEKVAHPAMAMTMAQRLTPTVENRDMRFNPVILVFSC
jgi:hypothetical protein